MSGESWDGESSQLIMSITCSFDPLNSVSLDFLIFFCPFFLQTPRKTPTLDQLPYPGELNTVGENDTTLEMALFCHWMGGDFPNHHSWLSSMVAWVLFGH